MSHKIYRPHEIFVSNIVLKKRICNGCELYNIPLKYLSTDLIIQSPIVFLPYGINKFNNKSYIDFSFLNLEVDKTMNNFKTKLEEINKYINEIFNKKYSNLLFINSIKKSFNNFPEKMRCSINESILVFDENKKILDYDYLQSKSYCKLLLYPSSIWTNKSHYGIKWEIAQVKLYQKTILNTYSFIDDSLDSNTNTDLNNNTINYKTHPKYQKYFKMISKGVPKEAVKHKMRIDNLDPCVLDNNFEEKPNISNKLEIVKPNFLNELKLSNIKNLKKVEQITKNEIPKQTTIPLISLNEIKDILGNLKKI